MKVRYKDRNYEVSMVKENENLLFKINNKLTKIDTEQVLENLIHCRESGARQKIFISDDKENYYISIEGKLLTLEKATDEEKSFESKAETSDKLVLVAPMPGSVVKVIVNIGDKVKEGDALIILEAMKMETTLYSTIDGIVKELNVVSGEQVDPIKVLMVIEKD